MSPEGLSAAMGLSGSGQVQTGFGNLESTSMGWNVWGRERTRTGSEIRYPLTEPPFSNAKELHDVIDSTPLSDVAWESFSLQHNGTQPIDNIRSWMLVEYNVWF